VWWKKNCRKRYPNQPTLDHRSLHQLGQFLLGAWCWSGGPKDANMLRHGGAVTGSLPGIWRSIVVSVAVGSWSQVILTWTEQLDQFLALKSCFKTRFFWKPWTIWTHVVTSQRRNSFSTGQNRYPIWNRAWWVLNIDWRSQQTELLHVAASLIYGVLLELGPHKKWCHFVMKNSGLKACPSRSSLTRILTPELNITLW